MKMGRDTEKNLEVINVENRMRCLRERIAQLRKESGLTQGQFALEIGTSRSSVASWEKGTRKPDMFQLSAIAEYYNVSVEYLLGFVNEKDKRMKMHI